MPNRTLCNVLDEMRKANKTRNYSSMLGLIEEAQSMGNRMEAALFDKLDAQSYEDKKRVLKRQLRKAEKTLKTAQALAADQEEEDLVKELAEIRKTARISRWD